MFGWKLVREKKRDRQEEEAYREITKKLRESLLIVIRMCTRMIDIMSSDEPNEFVEISSAFLEYNGTIITSALFLYENKFSSGSFMMNSSNTVKDLCTDAPESLQKAVMFAKALSGSPSFEDVDLKEFYDEKLKDVVMAISKVKFECEHIYRCALPEFTRCESGMDIVAHYYNAKKEIRNELKHTIRFMKPIYVKKQSDTKLKEDVKQ